MRAWIYLTLVVLAACDTEPAFLKYKAKLELIDQIELAFDKSVDAEKSAVLSSTDPESAALAAESKSESEIVTRAISQLRELIPSDGPPQQVEDLRSLEVAWERLRAIDARVLALAVANSNLKAVQLSAGEGAAALNRFVDALSAIAAETSDPARLRELSQASIAALRIQTLLPTHIASPDGGEMDRFEQQIAGWDRSVDRILVDLQAGAAAEERPHVKEAVAAWKEYEGVNAEVFRLSRQNSDVQAFALSTNEKRSAAKAFREAVAALEERVQASLPATR